MIIISITAESQHSDANTARAPRNNMALSSDKLLTALALMAAVATGSTNESNSLGIYHKR